MNFVSIENLSKSFPDKVLFSNLSFGLNKGDKVALVAANGSGKTTLLKIIAGKESPESGSVVTRSGIKVGYLEQDPDFNQLVSIKDFIQDSHSNIFTIIRDYTKALQDQTQNYTPEIQARFEALSAKMEHYHAWDYERKIIELLTLFNISDIDQRLNTLSGGQKKRLSIALTLLDEPEVLLLDEPTNHLDIEMIEWLEKKLSATNITLLVVTHDRYFLNQVCNRIIELDEGRLYSYNGNYSRFLEKKTEREETERMEQVKARQLMKKELDWLQRMPKARTTKSKARIDSFYEIREKASGFKTKQNINLQIKMARVGGKILEVEQVSKKYGELTILNEFDYVFKKGERIGIIGKNGTGKSSFLNILTGIEKVDQGKVNKGQTTIFGYFKQEGIRVDENKKVLDVVRDIAENIVTGNGSTLSASQFLHYFLFSAEMQHTLVSKLSGGEKRRLLLLTVLIQNPNFLVMDEPTNDLDIDTLNKLEEFLSEFKGSLIIVSHDRFFLDKLVDHLFIFEGNGLINNFYGSYSEYRISRGQIKRQQHKAESIKVKTNNISAKKIKNIQVKTKLTYQEKIEMQRLEIEINEIEIEKSELEKKISCEKNSFQSLQEISNKIADLIQQSELKTNRWIELASYNE